MTIFSIEDDNIIIDGMKKYGNHSNPFIMISRDLNNRYSGKQISNRWSNYANPKLCHDPLTLDEKKFIFEQASKYRTFIHWKFIIQGLENKFNKTHSENKIKNYWYSIPLVKDH